MTMVDQLYDREYRHARGELNAALVAQLGRLAAAVRNSFAVLNRIEYSAPWASQPKRARSN
jgi:hypothetical protein